MRGNLENCQGKNARHDSYRKKRRTKRTGTGGRARHVRRVSRRQSPSSPVLFWLTHRALAALKVGRSSERHPGGPALFFFHKLFCDVKIIRCGRWNVGDGGC